MGRAPYQVGVFAYRKHSQSGYEYALFRRAIEAYWQSIAGGGEDGETPLLSAQREAFEEADIPTTQSYLQLTTSTYVSVAHFKPAQWPKDLYVIPVYYFAVDATRVEIQLSDEHSDYRWGNFDEGQQLLHWDSDKTALWELQQRLRH